MAATQQNVFVLTTDAVRWSIAELTQRQIHPFFLAYLFLRKWAAEQGTEDDIVPDWDELGEYLRVPGGPGGKPYLRPLWHGQIKDPGRYWLNPNLAGSYAPSSLRNVPLTVVETEGSHFALRGGHATLARQHLLYNGRVPTVALAGFLYRDFGFFPGGALGPLSLLQVFRQDFHYVESDPQYPELFDDEISGDAAAMLWFELVTADTPGVE